MASKETSTKQKKLETKSLKEYEPFKSEELKDSSLVIDTLLECLKDGDIESFRDILVSHLLTTNKSKLAKETGLSRRTIYDLIDPDKKFNPELETLTAILQKIAA